MNTPFSGVRRAAPTKRHRPAIWENMLGTVYAMNDQRQVEYFDYRWDDARAFAGVTDDRDPRLACKTENVRYTSSVAAEPRMRQLVLWITK